MEYCIKYFEIHILCKQLDFFFKECMHDLLENTRTRFLDILVLRVKSKCKVKVEVKIKEEKLKVNSDKIEKSGCISGWKKT